MSCTFVGFVAELVSVPASSDVKRLIINALHPCGSFVYELVLSLLFLALVLWSWS